MKTTLNKLRGTTFIVLIFTITIFSYNSLFAQSGWYPVYLDDTTGTIQSIFFTSPNTGYAAGAEVGGVAYPRVMKTTNAGTNWTDLITPLTDTANMFFRCVFFTNANTGFMTSAPSSGTNNGRILKTTNAGVTWSVYTPSVNKHMTRIWFVNSSTGFATGYRTILKTTDTGLNWVEVFIPNMNGYLFGIYFTSVNTGYVVGNLGYILKTTDCGTIWSPQNSYYNTSIWGVWFTDANTGVAVGGHSSNVGNKILRTTNGGNNWDSVQHSPSYGFLYDVTFINSLTGFIGGYGQILKTTNSGLNWYNQCLHVPDSGSFYVNGCLFTDANTGYIVGTSAQSNRYVLKTTDCGGPFVNVRPIGNEIPERYSLSHNYPNPFNPVTKITFALPKFGDVKLTLYDVLGREVAVLVNEKLTPGTYEVDFDGTNCPSGVYFYTLRTGDFVDTKKMVLVK